YPFKFSFNKNGHLYVESKTCEGLKKFSLAEINAVLLERMKEAAIEYQEGFNNGESVKKAVITVPQYYWEDDKLNPLVLSAVEAAKLADIEIIDIIEETHADLLYYMSNERYSEKIKPGMKVAILDIGGG